MLGAEGYVFELERRGYIKAGPYVPEVVLDYPGAVLELHREFLRAGADVMVALTYYAHREKLRDVGREGDLEAMNRQAVRLAREIAREGGALVAGNRVGSAPCARALRWDPCPGAVRPVEPSWTMSPAAGTEWLTATGVTQRSRVPAAPRLRSGTGTSRPARRGGGSC